MFKFLKTMRDKDSKGFSLIEVMVAMTFLGIGLLAVAQMVPAGMVGLTQARLRTTAIHDAQVKMDELRARDFSELVAGSYTESDSTRNLAWTITVDDPIAGMKRIDMAASWQHVTGTRSVDLNTYVSGRQ